MSNTIYLDSKDAVTSIVKALAPIAQRLGQGAEAIYQAYYKQTILTGIEQIIMSLIVIGMVVFGAWYLLRRLESARKRISAFEPQDKRFSTGDEDYIKIGIKSGVIFAEVLIVYVALMISMHALPTLLNGVNYVLNPNYQTIQVIISQLRGGI